MPDTYSPVHYVQKYDFISIWGNYENHTYLKPHRVTSQKMHVSIFSKANMATILDSEKNGNLQMLLSQFIDS